ncbi:MAG: 2-amino-4-hydroxy-6-hydroxymethyldihydropteridine diphosphokinase [Planctomycetota bacterium]
MVAYVALGSNLGDRDDYLKRALAALADLDGVNSVTASDTYETDPVGPQDQGLFLNAAARVETTLSPEALLEKLQAIEARLGRAAPEDRAHWGPREIDLDLLLHGQTVLDLPHLTLPHPRLHERAFVLQPMCDLAPDLVHPTLGRTMLQWLSEVDQEIKEGVMS